MRAVLSPKNLLLARLTGRLTTDTVNAAYTLASDVVGRTWNSAVLDQLKFDTTLFPPREGLDLLDSAGRMPVAIAGGSVRSTHAAKLRADVLARPLLISQEREVTSLGTAALAFVATGFFSGLETARSRLLSIVREVPPDTAHAARYTEIYERWRELREVIDSAQEDAASSSEEPR